ncbi:hypothetical protein A6769_37230 [Nostoc punctiforme NIES-2108]|uniref:Uncharacterized protein n=1 Tax=Nostoc punctiforme NIES-2108 TaxID=1356359 RepID=A0A367S141_NOSPU|nr:hypothetical protein A6769_37230 [Nostoc punctiforme NIES-2108]
MSQWDELGKQLAIQLKDVSTEEQIKELCENAVNQIRKTYSEINSRKTPLSTLKKAILSAYPSTETQQHSLQYFTNKGKGNIERYEHLALKYLTLSSEEWDKVGDNNRKDWKKEKLQKTVNQSETLSQSETVKQSETTTNDLETMTISQLNLDTKTEKLVSDAIAYSGISLADFIRKACKDQATTLLQKQKHNDKDLTNVSTEELLKDKKYKTHPSRADELVRRAIYALKNHNDNCTEKSQKWHINQTAIQVLTGSKVEKIKKILENYQTQIDYHNNTKHQLKPIDNRKEIKIDDDIDLKILAPIGVDLI